MDEEERDALIARMRSVGTLSEMDAAMEEARGWLRGHPGDDRVAAAMQCLEEREERLRDPESAQGWSGVVAAAIVGLVVGAAVYMFSGSLAYSVVAALFIGVEFGFWGWGLAVTMFEKVRRNRSDRSGG